VAEPLLDLGVLLAGGKGRRMGGVDKGALMLGDQRLADIAINKLRPLSRQLAVSANAAPDWMPEYAQLIEDRLDSEGASVGPAGGIIAALEATQSGYGEGGLMGTMPLDAPFVPVDLFARLLEAMGDADVILARHQDRLQPVFGIWRARVAGKARQIVFGQGQHSLHGLTKALSMRTLDLDLGDEAFVNINTAEDLNRARTIHEAGH
tara:strand:- start:463 stop:1083 length:621 start_codon:yes stop_codon:yes gene_type:complete